MNEILIKTPEQIEGIRKSCQLASQTLDFIKPYVVPGVSTNYLNDLIEKYTKDHGAICAPLNYKGFPKSSCISINEVICHGIPDESILKEGDIVNIDVTSILNGYYGDTSQMFSVGKVSQTSKKLMLAAKMALKIGIMQVKPGLRFGMIGYAISNFIKRTGFSVVYQFCGHGVGINFHEPPNVNHIDEFDQGELMKPGMVFTIEPMINEKKPEARVLSDGWTASTVDGGLSAQYEHTVLVTDNGVEVLT